MQKYRFLAVGVQDNSPVEAPLKRFVQAGQIIAFLFVIGITRQTAVPAFVFGEGWINPILRSRFMLNLEPPQT